jgi:integrase
VSEACDLRWDDLDLPKRQSMHVPLLPFPIHVHMLRHSTGYALANRGMDTRRLQHFLGHASITNTVIYTK